MNKHNFKVGDRVRMVDGAVRRWVVRPGEEATVVGAEPGSEYITVVGTRGRQQYYAWRFELVGGVKPSAEADPSGVDPHTPGAKLDAGKVEFGLIMNGMPRALRQVARVATYGANKYTRDGWLSVPDGPRRYTDALHRHLNAEACGALHDPDTQLEHAAHAAWNALARLELLLRGQGTA